MSPDTVQVYLECRGREVLHWTNATTGIAEHCLLLQKAMTALMAPKG